MRKQIKFAAVLSTAAFLAVCTSLASFAANGWMEENGSWAYYDTRGERITEGWVKDRDHWYWLDENGCMVSGGLFRINGEYYYFQEDGTMASDKWVKVAEENGEAEATDHWYYFQKDGRACRGKEPEATELSGAGAFTVSGGVSGYDRVASPSNASAGTGMTVNGRQYAFDARGRMLYGWVSEGEDEKGNTDWSYYGKKGEQITEGWVKDKDHWYWLDEKGDMVSGGLFQIKEDYYYFRQDGTMVSEEWVAIPNENAGEEDEPEQYWYYFQKNGKACRRPDSASSGSLKAKTINGKKYAFDSEGRMLYGWVSEGERQTGEDAWEQSDYYFGTENDGFMQQGWARLAIVADGVEDDQPGSDVWDEDQERWFYFGANGKKVKAKEEGDYRLKTINGNQYGFDEYGRMIGSWYADPDEITLATNRTDAAADGKTEYQGQASYTKKFMYFGPPESGVRYKKGWFTAMPSEYLMKSKYDEQEQYTYYADKDGNLCANEIKTINGERYGFDSSGRLLNGLVCLNMESEDSSSKFENSFYSDASVREGRAPFGSEEEFDELVESYAEEFQSHKMRFYWFGGTNGTMLTGKQNVPLVKGDETFEFMFETSGRLKGSGVYGEKKGRLYKAGKLQKPEEGDRYAIFKMSYTTLPEDATAEEKATFEKRDLDGDGKIDGVISRISVREFMDEVCNSGIYDEDKEETVWTVRYDPPDVTYYLVGANGNIVKNKKKAVDVDGYQFWVKNKKIQTITVED